MSNGDPIVIRGGTSIEIVLHKDFFPANPTQPELHLCNERKITRVELIDDNTKVSTDWPIPEKGKCTIKIYHEVE